MKDRNFERALAALASVRSGGVRPYVVVTRAARQRIYAISPSFAQLARYLDIPIEQEGWTRTTCSRDPSLCGEIGSGWFLWALRDAAAAAGHYGTPREASAFFGQIADEISGACSAGALECTPQVLSIMPPVDWREAMQLFPARLLDAVNLLTLTRLPVDVGPSSGSQEALEGTLRFLNYPVHTRSLQAPVAATTYQLRGWYYSSGNEWMTVSASDPTAELRIERKSSPDLQQVFKDPAASEQRFIVHLACTDDCSLKFQAADGASAEKQVQELRHVPFAFAVGRGRVHIERAEVQNSPTLRSYEISNSVRAAIIANYWLLYLPLVGIGLIAFLVTTVGWWRNAALNTCYAIAAASWMMAISRMGILVVLDVTTFPGVLSQAHLGPVYFFLVCGAVFSCAAFLQVWNSRRQAMG